MLWSGWESHTDSLVFWWCCFESQSSARCTNEERSLAKQPLSLRGSAHTELTLVDDKELCYGTVTHSAYHQSHPHCCAASQSNELCNGVFVCIQTTPLVLSWLVAVYFRCSRSGLRCLMLNCCTVGFISRARQTSSNSLTKFCEHGIQNNDWTLTWLLNQWLTLHLAVQQVVTLNAAGIPLWIISWWKLRSLLSFVNSNRLALSCLTIINKQYPGMWHTNPVTMNRRFVMISSNYSHAIPLLYWQ